MLLKSKLNSYCGFRHIPSCSSSEEVRQDQVLRGRIESLSQDGKVAHLTATVSDLVFIWALQKHGGSEEL